ncbi:hypothetical protein HELRODRAFT_105607 [Helobdella robusta]|uniref:Selenoprotein O n=1 Tax=Helobdella robusta TaxID=6412 RepID=T1EDW6_HELRO|nr:hypothetical protein HELRODRAFT_105607 [Helobdella robusta]ESO12908.1 hypothetical protein HELRODRAFT_105607 [Helobdella robusta]
MFHNLVNLLKINCAGLSKRHRKMLKMTSSLFQRNPESPTVSLETLTFDDKAMKCLPIDENKENIVRKVEGACYSKVLPTPITNPQLVSFSKSALELLDISLKEVERKEFISYFSGNSVLPGSIPLAHCYCGHQFGSFAGQLGDGAAITLGTVINRKSERWEVQLKGAGLTPYSRTADGRKVLRSSLREFLCSEAMYYLNVPTTRASSIITSDTMVVRDVFYDGNPILERCSVVCRLAPSFIRFGSFEICKGADRVTNNYGPSVAHSYILNHLADYVIETFYPQIWDNYKENKKVMYTEFLTEVLRRTAKLVAHWQSIGWCHGVLNTDNMSILGLTIDYGPYGFLDHYDPHYIPNASDTAGRYMFKNQPSICKWNCMMLAKSLQGLTSGVEADVEEFDAIFEKSYLEIMRKKLGLLTEQESDRLLVEELLDTMNKTGADYTNTFVCFNQLRLADCFATDGAGNCNSNQQHISEVTKMLLQQCPSADEMKSYYATKVDFCTLDRALEILRSDSPLTQMMIGQKDVLLNEEYKMKRYLYYNNPELEKTDHDNNLWTRWLEKYVARLRQDYQQTNVRTRVGSCVDEQFIPRNYIVQQAIQAAEHGDYFLVNRILKRVERPFDEDEDDYNLENSEMKERSGEPYIKLSDHTCYLKRHPKQSLRNMLT